jgi:hypothetical protein
MSDKVKIIVAKPFRLNLGGDAQIEFASGTHEVDAEVADHWFVKEHLLAGTGAVEATVGAELNAVSAELEAAKAKIDQLSSELLEVNGKLVLAEAELAALKTPSVSPAEAAAAAAEAEATGRRTTRRS